MSRRKWIEPEAFRDLRKQSRLTRKQAAEALDVTPRTIQNWENGGARIPWMAFKLLRLLKGYALPGVDWEGWTVRGKLLIAPNGKTFEAANLRELEHTFALARLWREQYSREARARKAQQEQSRVVAFPRKPAPEEQQPATRYGGMTR